MSQIVTPLYKSFSIQICYMSTNGRKTGILVGFIKYKKNRNQKELKKGKSFDRIFIIRNFNGGDT